MKSWTRCRPARQDKGALLRAPYYSGLLRSPLTVAANVVLLEVLQRAVLSDGLLDVRGRGVLHALAGHLAGENQRKRIATLGSLLLALGSNGSSTLSLSLCVKGPAIQAERDLLFDKWLRAYDNYQSWLNKAVHVYTTNRSNQNPLKMDVILKRHVEDLSEQLRTYDDRINAAKTTGPLQYC